MNDFDREDSAYGVVTERGMVPDWTPEPKLEPQSESEENDVVESG